MREDLISYMRRFAFKGKKNDVKLHLSDKCLCMYKKNAIVKSSRKSLELNMNGFLIKLIPAIHDLQIGIRWGKNIIKPRPDLNLDCFDNL